MRDTLDDKITGDAKNNYPVIFAGQREEGGMKRLKAFCSKNLQIIEGCKNVRSLQAPSGKPEDNKNFSKDLWKRDLPFDQLTTSVETLVFYLKMCGDYKRYLAEMMEDRDDELKKAAINFYEEAYSTAELILQATHPTRLGLSL